MTSKSALFALAVVVLMGSMAVAALAEDQGLTLYATADSLLWPESEHVGQPPVAAEIREPMETGAVPDRSESSSFQKSAGDEQTVEYGGLKYRPSIDSP